jgi:hypothetical protein
MLTKPDELGSDLDDSEDEEEESIESTIFGHYTKVR